LWSAEGARPLLAREQLLVDSAEAPAAEKRDYIAGLCDFAEPRDDCVGAALGKCTAALRIQIARDACGIERRAGLETLGPIHRADERAVGVREGVGEIVLDRRAAHRV